MPAIFFGPTIVKITRSCDGCHSLKMGQKPEGQPVCFTPRLCNDPQTANRPKLMFGRDTPDWCPYLNG